MASTVAEQIGGDTFNFNRWLFALAVERTASGERDGTGCGKLRCGVVSVRFVGTSSEIQTQVAQQQTNLGVDHKLYGDTRSFMYELMYCTSKIVGAPPRFQTAWKYELARHCTAPPCAQEHRV